METPKDYRYFKEHTWLRVLSDNEAQIGITDFAQSELGEIVYVDLHLPVSNLKRMKYLVPLKR